ncbi:MAG: NAD(P)H-quinone oxidoreductase [Chitinophagales bacterium]
MKAIQLRQFGSPDNFYIAEYDTPQPNAYEIQVKVTATALNRADTLQRMGKYPPPQGASPILGLEMSGTVSKLGSEVSKWKIGDKVCALLSGGGYAEYVTIHENLAASIPSNLTLLESAAIPEVFLTAYQALIWLAQLQQGESILIHAGASGVGTAAIQIAREKGAKVYITASKSKHSICLQLGASKAIDYKAENFEEVVLKETDGKGVDVVLDFLAAPYFQKNLNCLAVDGRMVMLALMGGIKVENLNVAPILQKRLKIMGSTLRSRTLEYKVQLTHDFWEFAHELFVEKRLQPVVDSTFNWSDVAEAHQYMEANKNKGKVLLKVSGD